MTADLTDRHALLRELILDASMEVLDKCGLGLRPDAVTYSRVFTHLAENYGVSISRGSVHGRIWDSQEDYRLEVLATAAQYSSPDDRLLRGEVPGVLAQLDGTDGRKRMVAFCRVIGRTLLDSSLESESFRRFQAIKAVVRATGHDVDEATATATTFLQSIVRESAYRNQAGRIENLEFMVDALGLRARTGLGLDHDHAVSLLATMVHMLVTGTHLDHHAGFNAMASKVETALEADEECSWTYFAFGFLAFMDFLFEIDPAARLDDYGGAAVPPPSTSNGEPPDLSTLVGNRPRRRRRDLHRLVVAAGVELLLRDGIGLQAESITYARVFDHIRRTRNITINRSTVHGHIWRSQAQFRREVLAAAARYGTEETKETMRTAMAAQSVTRNPDRSVNVRQLILDNTLATVTAHMKVVVTSPAFRRWQSIKAAMLSSSPDHEMDDVRQAVHEGYADIIGVFADIFRSVLPLVNLEVNPELEMTDDQAYHLLSVICYTLTTGADFNISSGAEPAGRVVALPRADGSGQLEDWPIAAAAALATLDLLFVPRNDDEHP